jgi:Fe2+ or Zn2+ uptake regulation protein
MAGPAPARRSTRQRRLIRDAVRSTDSHPTAEWVYEEVRRLLPRISLGTVYRNLQVLVDEGTLRSWTRGGRTRYDADLSTHDHFSCRECGLLLDLERTPRAFAEERRLRARGHEIVEHVLEFVGICRDCRHRRKNAGHKGWSAPRTSHAGSSRNASRKEQGS